MYLQSDLCVYNEFSTYAHCIRNVYKMYNVCIFEIGSSKKLCSHSLFAHVLLAFKFAFLDRHQLPKLASLWRHDLHFFSFFFFGRSKSGCRWISKKQQQQQQQKTFIPNLGKSPILMKDFCFPLHQCNIIIDAYAMLC